MQTGLCKKQLIFWQNKSYYITFEVVRRSDIFRAALLLINSYLGPRRINGILFALKSENSAIHLAETKVFSINHTYGTDELYLVGYYDRHGKLGIIFGN